MTSEPPAKKTAKKPAKKASKKEQEVLSKAAASPTVRKTRTRKTVTAKVEPPADELTSEAQGVVEAVSSQLDEVISKARAAGVPMLFGSCTVSLHFEFEDASDPIEAVQKAINGIVNEGLTRWTWIVRDETSDDLHAVADGRIVPLEAARVGP